MSLVCESEMSKMKVCLCRCTMCTVCQHITLHSLMTFHHANTRGSRLKIASLGVPKNSLSSTCHVSFLAVPDTDHQHKFSLTSPIFQSFSPSHPSLLTHDPHTPCDDSRRSVGSSEIPSPTRYEPKRIELDRNLEIEHQDPDPRHNHGRCLSKSNH